MRANLPAKPVREPAMPQPRAGIVLGSSSDEEKAQAAAVMLEKFGVEYELEVISAHRSPGRLAGYAASAEDRGLQVIIAAAGKAAALPGVIAAHTVLPVIGLPIFTPQLGGQDSLYSMVQMPSGVPVATVGLDAAVNAGLLAVQILAIADPQLRKQLREFKHQLDEGLRL
jgi:5-(carboxyamino)imidazole ribonucleotide mutase